MAKRISLILLSLLLLVTVSFAWILQKETERVKRIEYTQTLTITKHNVDMSIWLLEDGKYVNISDSTDKSAASKPLVAVNNVVPHQSVVFKIRLKNNSEHTVSVRLSISDLICADKMVENEMVYLSTTPGNQYNQYPSVTKPQSKYNPINTTGVKKLDTDKYALTLYDDLQIPSTPNEGEFVEIECYFYFDKRMDNTYQGLPFQAVTFQIAE